LLSPCTYKSKRLLAYLRFHRYRESDIADFAGGGRSGVRPGWDGIGVRMTKDWVAVAAANNAAWCDAVCRSHGAPGEFRSGLWLNLRQVPPFYPNAITLAGPARSADQLQGIADLLAAGIAGGCAVKDSFGALDLAPIGFEVLFEATWLFRPDANSRLDPAAATGQGSRVAHPADLAAWEKAFRGAPGTGDGGSPPLFRPALLADANIAFLVCSRRDEIIGGAIANRAAGVIGLSNVFAAADDLDAVWAMAVAHAEATFPGLPIVGYEDAGSIAALRKFGFEPLAPLRVWVAAAS
jgi:hypothetical protein